MICRNALFRSHQLQKKCNRTSEWAFSAATPMPRSMHHHRFSKIKAIPFAPNCGPSGGAAVNRILKINNSTGWMALTLLLLLQLFAPAVLCWHCCCCWCVGPPNKKKNHTCGWTSNRGQTCRATNYRIGKAIGKGQMLCIVERNAPPKQCPLHKLVQTSPDSWSWRPGNEKSKPCNKVCKLINDRKELQALLEIQALQEIMQACV